MNQNLGQFTRDRIDAILITSSSWVIQNKNKVDLYAGDGIAVREHQTNTDLAGYVQFEYKKLVGITENVGMLINYTAYRDPKPRFHQVVTFLTLVKFKKWLEQN